MGWLYQNDEPSSTIGGSVAYRMVTVNSPIVHILESNLPCKHPVRHQYSTI
jgi:hypothetical protein